MLFQFLMIAIREIKILNKLHHENVIKLKEIVTSPGTFFSDLNNIVLTRFLHSCLTFFLSDTVQEKDDQRRPCKLSMFMILVNYFITLLLYLVSFVFSIFVLYFTDDNKYKGGIYMVYVIDTQLWFVIFGFVISRICNLWTT
jgi:hypothetical protein